MKLLKLQIIHPIRSIGHKAGGILYLGECDNLPNIFCFCQKHYKPVKQSILFDSAKFFPDDHTEYNRIA